ncbi:MAG: PilW family protein [Proteobacteria bacterium]|nr:PilW family protein [Pseudomonadota bacterium]
MRAQRRRRSGESGVTIVELMVSIVLAAILAGGLFALFSGQQRTYSRQMEGIGIQQSLGGALEHLERQVRLAGFGLAGPCPGGVLRAGTGTGAATQAALVLYNACNLFGQSPTACCSSANLAACSSSMSTGAPDALSIAYAADVTNPNLFGGIRLTRALGPNDELAYVGATGGMVTNGQFLLWEPGTTTPCVLRQLTANPTAVGAEFLLAHNSAAPINGGSGTNQAFPTGTLLFPVAPNSRPRHFAIDTTTNPPQLVTWSTLAANPSSDRANLEVLAEGVESLQVAYACDVGDNAGTGAGDGQLAEGSTLAERRVDEWAFNAPGETYVPNCSVRPIRAVRLTLIGRGASGDPRDKVGRRPGTEDQPEGTAAADHALSKGGSFQREVLSVQVRPRNIL